MVTTLKKFVERAEFPLEGEANIMSTISGVSGSSTVQETSPIPRASSEPTAGNVDDSLQSLQKLMQQIEGAANTKAIPAHQSW